MEAIYDVSGRAVAWRRRAAVFDGAGKPRAFVSQGAVFTYKGRYLGRFEDGWYRDPDGNAVAFEAGATGGPLPPVPQAGAIAPLPLPDPPPLKVEAPPSRFRSSKWSTISWDDFLAGAATVAIR